MKKNHVLFLPLAAGLLLLIACAGCTSMGFGFDDPVGEMSLVGELTLSCVSGRIFYFGNARNTGDVTLRDVIAQIDVFDGGGGFAGRFEGPVAKSADVEEIRDEEGETIDEIVTYDDIFLVQEMGVFSIQSSVGCGSSSREEVHFTFTAPYTEEF